MDCELIHNACFRSDARSLPVLKPGVYRVILDLPEPAIDSIVVVHITRDKESPSEAPEGEEGGNEAGKKKRKRKPPPPLVGDLIWLSRGVLLGLKNDGLLTPIEIERKVVDPPTKVKYIEEHVLRCKAMACFLDIERLADGILVHHGLAGLVREAQKVSGLSRYTVYNLWSRICRFGFSERSLTPRHDLQGAPGVPRPCDPDGRKKAGRKTTDQRVAWVTRREVLPPVQPGMSSEWTFRILAADGVIKPPKPKMPTRVQTVLNDFRTKAVEVNGDIKFVLPDRGLYPARRQIARVLSTTFSALEKLRQSTTEKHFDRNLRGLTGRNWKGVAGPGHTWAIDSTIADMFLRSSLNRSWIIGRPIVYVIVDVWSTAVVGFHVCLTGPSWDTAKVSLFNAVASPDLMGALWALDWRRSLVPHPTLCFALMCDRGEYLSMKHRFTAAKLIPLTRYAMPYRPDLKGLVEVLHRIEKDAQFFFVPGALDARRKEMEKWKGDPSKCVFTLPQYVAYLHQLFTLYNLTADRSKRLDAHMISAGVYPSPSGLWSWGHQTGIGFRRHFPESELIAELLPRSVATVGRSSVVHAKCDYMSEVVKQEQWTAIARNFGSWELPTHYYPGSMSRIWTPNPAEPGLLTLELTDESRASAETPYDDWLDAQAIQTMRQPDQEHQANQEIQRSRDRMQAIVESAKSQTAAALQMASGAKPPPMREARAMEVAAQPAVSKQPSSEQKVLDEVRENAFDAYYAAYRDALKGAP